MAGQRLGVGSQDAKGKDGLDAGSRGQPMRRLRSHHWAVGSATEKRLLSALTPARTQLGVVNGTWDGREAQEPSPSAPQT